MATLEVIPGDPFYPTYAAAWTLASSNDFILGNAVGAATTYYDEALLNLTGKTGITLGVHAGDEGLVVVRPVTNQSYIWRIDSTGTTIQDIIFHHNSKNLLQLLVAYNGNDCTISRCNFTIGAVSDYCIESNAYDVTGWVIEDCVFTGASSGATNYGYGVKCDHLVAVEISRCTFYSFLYHISHAYTAIVDSCRFNGRAGSTLSWGLYRFRDGAVAKNCVFFDMTYTIHCDVACTSGGVFGNTFYNCTRALTTGAGDYPFAFDNNAIVNCVYGIFGNTSWGPAPDSNLFYNNGTDIVSYTAPVNSQTTDPLFTDAPGHDFTWPTDGSSPLDDNGKLLTGIDDWDIIGTARPQGPTPDIGAYECFPPLWTTITRTFVFNRATRVSDGVTTTWASKGPDPTMAYHPDGPDPADYNTFVVIGASYA